MSEKMPFTANELDILLSPMKSPNDWKNLLAGRGQFREDEFMDDLHTFLYWNIIKSDAHADHFWMIIEANSVLAHYLRGEFNEE